MGKKGVSGNSAKGRQHGAHGKKYMKQAIRTSKHKDLAQSKHLLCHPNDKQGKEQIKKARQV